MSISVNDTLPNATLLLGSSTEPTPVELSDKLKDRKIVIFAVPGAYTSVCSTAHMPSFITNAGLLMSKGVEEVICISVNDPFVQDAWAKSTGANEAGITMLCDPEATFTKALGLDFSAPHVGLINRSHRYAMVVDNGVVTTLNVEENPGECSMSAAEVILEAL